MLPTFISGMMRLMIMKFMTNDIPHAIGLVHDESVSTKGLKPGTKGYETIELYNQGYTLAEIASKLDTNIPVITSRIAAARLRYGESIAPRRHKKQETKQGPKPGTTTAKIVELYKQGYKLSDIEAELKLDQGYVNSILDRVRKKYGTELLPYRKERGLAVPKPDTVTAKIVDLYNEGLKIREIADVMKMNTSAVGVIIYDARKKYGVGVVPHRNKRGTTV